MKKNFSHKSKLIVRYQRIILFIVPITCIALSATTRWYLYKQQQNSIISEFQKNASIQTISLHRSLTSNMIALDSLSIGFDNPKHLYYKKLEINAKKILESNKYIKVLAFTSKLQNSNRDKIEKQQQKTYPNFRVSEQIPTGGFTIAKKKSEYYPIYFIFPKFIAESVIGLDLSTSKNVLMALKSAEKTGHVNATLTYLNSNKSNKLLLEISPLYNKTTLQASGFMLAFFNLDQIFNSVLSDDLDNVDLKVIDNNTTTDKLLYHRGTNLSLESSLTYTVEIPDEYDSFNWSLTATPSTQYINHRQSRIPELVFILGLALSFILTAYLRILLNATRIVERLVKKKTLELKLANEQLTILNRTDALTEIFNRRYLNMMLEQEWSRAIRNKSILSFILIDIDFFKLYNDNYGHVKGDGCLRKVAQALASTISRPADICARYGGEEFAIILPETRKAKIVAERCRNAILELAIEHKYSLIANVITISIGVCSMLPKRDSNPNEIINVADQALYQAKVAGKNQIISLTKLD